MNGIEKSVPRVSVWHHEANLVMTNGDPEGQIFLFHPNTREELSWSRQHAQGRVN